MTFAGLNETQKQYRWFYSELSRCFREDGPPDPAAEAIMLRRLEALWDRMSRAEREPFFHPSLLRRERVGPVSADFARRIVTC